MNKKEENYLLESKLHSINTSLYREFRKTYGLPEWLSRSLVKTERRFRKKEETSKINYYTKLTTAGIAIGSFPRDIQVVLGRSIGIPKEDIHLLTALKSIPEPAEIILASAMVANANNGGIPKYQLITAGILITDKLIYTTLPLITKKNYLRPISIFTNPVVGTAAIIVGSKKAYKWLEPKFQKINEEIQDTKNYFHNLPKVASEKERELFKQDLSELIEKYYHLTQKKGGEIISTISMLGTYRLNKIKKSNVVNKFYNQDK